MITAEFQAALDQIAALFTQASGSDSADVAAARAEDLAALEALIVTLEASLPASTAPQITTTSLSDGVVGQAYSATLTATGAPPVTFASVPVSDNGVMVNADGTITGTPAAAATSTFVITPTDANGVAGAAVTLTLTAA